MNKFLSILLMAPFIFVVIYWFWYIVRPNDFFEFVKIVGVILIIVVFMALFVIGLGRLLEK